MIIGIPKEIMHDEARVAATPETVGKFVQEGFEVLVENHAGDGALCEVFFAAMQSAAFVDSDPLKLIDIAVRGVFDGLYTAEDFDLAWNALNHDNDVAEARAAGEVAGRNEKIAAARRDRNTAGAMPPAPVGGQGGRTMERQPKGQRDIWDNLSA